MGTVPGRAHTHAAEVDEPGGEVAPSKHGIIEAPHEAHASPCSPKWGISALQLGYSGAIAGL